MVTKDEVGSFLTPWQASLISIANILSASLVGLLVE